ncbi:MAG: hypothetical protein WDW36_002362 [Sanguina aurantia]
MGQQQAHASGCQPPLTHADPVLQHTTLQVSFGKGKGGPPLRLFGVMKEQGARRDTPSQAGSEEPGPAQGDSSQQRLQAQEAFVAQLKLSEYKCKVVMLEGELRTAQEDRASASDAAQQSAAEKESLARKVTALKGGLRAVQDKRDLLDREGERLKEQVGSLSADLGKWAAQVTSLQAAKQKDENEHMRVMFAESARCAQLERNLKLAQARHSKTKLPLEEMAGLLGEDKSAWMDVLSVGRNTEVLLVAEAEALKKQLLTQTGAMCELAESHALQVKELEGEKRACKIEMLRLEYKLSTLEGEAAAAAAAAKDAAQLAACAAAQRQSRPQQQPPQHQHPQTSYRHPQQQQQQSNTSQWQQLQPHQHQQQQPHQHQQQQHQQQQHTSAGPRDSRGALEAGMVWLSHREASEDAAARAQGVGRAPYSTTTPPIRCAQSHAAAAHTRHRSSPAPALLSQAAAPPPTPISSSQPRATFSPTHPSLPHPPPQQHTHHPPLPHQHRSTDRPHCLSPLSPPTRLHQTHPRWIQIHSPRAGAGRGSNIPSQPYQPRSGVESCEQAAAAAAEMGGLSEGEDGGWGGGLDQLSSLLDAGFGGSDGEPEHDENEEREEEDADAALAEYEELRMGQPLSAAIAQMDLPPSPLPAVAGLAAKGHPRLAGVHAPGGDGASAGGGHALPGKRRKQESSFIGRVTNIDHHVTLPNKKSSAGKAACKPISSYFKKASG